MKPRFPLPQLAGVVLAGLSFFSCSTLQERMRQIQRIDTMVIEQRYSLAVDAIDQARGTLYRERDAVLYHLDKGVLYHYAGEYVLSNEMLSAAESLIDQYFALSITQAAGSILLNDTVLDYAGEDYEDIYINIFKALNYLNLDEPEKAFVEVRRVDEKLSILEDKYTEMAANMANSDEVQVEFRAGKSRFYSSALARYISFLLYEESGAFDEAQIDLQKIKDAYRLQPDVYPYPPLELVPEGKSKNNATIDIVGFVGRSPVKLASTLRIRTERNRAVIINSNEGETVGVLKANANVVFWPGIEEGYHFKLQLPYMVERESLVKSVFVSVDNGELTKLLPFESIERIARVTYEVKEPLIYLKTITRTIIKGILAERAKERMSGRSGGLFALVGRIATDLVVDASEEADLRISRYFPATAYVGRFYVAPGLHTIRIEYYAADSQLLYSDIIDDFEVGRDGLNLLETAYLR